MISAAKAWMRGLSYGIFFVISFPVLCHVQSRSHHLKPLLCKFIELLFSAVLRDYEATLEAVGFDGEFNSFHGFTSSHLFDDEGAEGLMPRLSFSYVALSSCMAAVVPPESGWSFFDNSL